MARAEGAIEGPIVGHLLDRYGPRPVMIAAVTLMGIGYLLLSQIESYGAFVLVYTVLISLTHSGGFMHAPMTLTNTWFIRWRARAMTINSAAYGFGGMLIAPMLSMIVHSWGWRWGAAFAGIIVSRFRHPALSHHPAITGKHGTAARRRQRQQAYHDRTDAQQRRERNQHHAAPSDALFCLLGAWFSAPPCATPPIMRSPPTSSR